MTHGAAQNSLMYMEMDGGLEAVQHAINVYKALELGIILHAALPMDMMFQRLMEDVQRNFLTN